MWAFSLLSGNVLWLPPSPQTLWAAQTLLCGDFIHLMAQEAAANVSCCREQHDAQLLITTGPYFILPLPYPIPGQCRHPHLNMAHGVSACERLALGQPVWCWEHPYPLGLSGGPSPSAAPQDWGMTQGSAGRAQGERVLPPACLL